MLTDRRTYTRSSTCTQTVLTGGAAALTVYHDTVQPGALAVNDGTAGMGLMGQICNKVEATGSGREGEKDRRLKDERGKKERKEEGTPT